MKRYYGYSEDSTYGVEWDTKSQVLTVTCPPGTSVVCSDTNDGITPIVISIYKQGRK